jgi:hypothetical protein
MATIVDIRTAASARPSRGSSARSGGSAEILLFTGVQYVRWDSGGGGAETSRRRKERDRLDLED